MTLAPLAYRESARLLPCEGARLLAVLAEPSGDATTDLGVVIVVGGPQYRAGSHRHFVEMARALAGAGFCTLRFDVRGMGDSTGAQRNFEQLGPDIGAAIDDLLAARPRLRRVALWGLCDGASAALLYLHERADPRVAALCLLNPWVRSEASLARTHVKHYYRQRLAQREFWVKLMSGRVAGQALRGLWANIRAARRPGTPQGPNVQKAPYQARIAAAWAAFDGPVLLALSSDDYTAKEFIEYTAVTPEWRGLAQRPCVSHHAALGADHTFSSAPARLALEQATLQWLAQLPRQATPGP
jgi:uncharacterized protein